MEKRSTARRQTKALIASRTRKPVEEPLRAEAVSVQSWMNHDFSSAEPAVNDHELTSITALITYIAYITNQNEFSIERQFADRFNIPNVKCLPSDRYDAAVRYLVDQVPPA